MPVLKDLLFALVLKIIENQVDQGDVDDAVVAVRDALRKLVAKTETKVDDQVLAAVEAFVTSDIVKTVTAEVVRGADQLANLTPTEKDDQIVAAIAKALGVTLPKISPTAEG